MSNVEHDRLISEPDWSRCEELIEAFESAWRGGQQPAVHEFVRGDGDFRRKLLIELVHTDLEFRAKSGEAVRVETYLASFPELACDRQTTLDLIAAEYEFRRRRSAVSIAEYQTRFPDHARDLNLGVTRADDDTRGFPQTALATDSKAWPEVPGFEILAELGRGGMGIVYQALELALGRHVALKFLPADYMHDHERLERFQREARTTSALNHPHICTIHGLGEQNGRPYIVMELVEGRTLQAVIAERPSVDEVLRIIAQVARALAAAHAAGVVHRDIKPDNIMLRSDGYVKVLDFGLARRLPTLLESDSPEAGHTDPCVILGTVAYMSPEQARGAAAQSASDIFSLGIVLYQLLTGKHPFEGASAADILTEITTRHPLSPSRFNPSVSRHLDGAIDAMLQKDVELRPSAVAVEAAIAAARGARRRCVAATSRTRPIVHREAELAVLRSKLADAEAGRGSILCIAGEPGIGKTTLVEDFLSELAPAEAPCLVARGQCSERLADTEAYVPVIDALQNLVRNDTTGWVARLISVVAPTWDGLIASNRDSSPVEGSSRALSQPAMLREFCALLEEASRQSVIVLFFDDVHWSDNSTVDLLAHFGRHCQRLRVVAVVTYRPTEMLLRPHPFHAVKLELQGRGDCRELALGFLTRGEIDHFLSLLFPGHRFSPDFANEISRRTEGNALFIADLLEYLRQREVIVHSDGQWALARQLPDLRDELPESVRSMIERKFMQLDKSERQLLAAAAVQGHEFDSAVVAGALGLDAADVEERLQSLDRVHHLVRLLREQEFQNRVLTQRYSFVHALYQQAMYNDLPPTRRASLAAALAQTMERLVSDDKSAAAELAYLYEVGRDFQAAVRHFYQATENAAQLFAHREAIGLAQRGLELLDSLPDAKRTEPEIRLLTALGLQLQVTKGYAAPDAQRAYMRARELCFRSPELSLEFPVLWGLWLCHKVRSELLEAQEVAQQLLILARQLNDPAPGAAGASGPGNDRFLSRRADGRVAEHRASGGNLRSSSARHAFGDVRPGSGRDLQSLRRGRTVAARVS